MENCEYAYVFPYWIAWPIYPPKSLGQCCLGDLGVNSYLIAATILSNLHAFMCTPCLSFKFVVIALQSFFTELCSPLLVRHLITLYANIV